jgi:hypothetical protein
MKEIWERYQIVVILSMTVVVFSVIRVVYGYKGGENLDEERVKITLPSPTPILIPTPTIDPEMSQNYPLWKLLPYEGQGFTVDRYIAPLTLAIKAKGLDDKIVQRKVAEWIANQGVDPGTHKIEIN